MATEAVQAAGEAAHKANMPQLDFTTYGNQIFWLLVALVVIYLFLSRVALPRIGAVLAERKGTITNDIAAAEELKAKALQAEAAYKQALADARVEAAKIVAETKASIQQELDAAIAAADAQIMAKAAESEKHIAAIRDSAMDDVAEVAKSAAADIVAALGGKAAAGAVDAAVAARLKG